MVVPPLVAAIAQDAAAAPAVARTALCLLAVAGDRRRSPTWRPPTRTSSRCAAYARARAGRRRPEPIWDVGSVEPGLDLARARPSGWTPAARGADGIACRAPTTASVRLPSRPGPASGRRRSPSPRSRVAPVAGRHRARRDGRAAQPGLAVSFVLPAGRRAGPVEPPRRRAARPLDRDLRRAAAGRARVPRELRPRSTPRRCATCASSPPPWARPTARAGSRRRGCRRTRTVWTADATWIVAPVRAADCAGAAVTLDYVTVTVFGVIAVQR